MALGLNHLRVFGAAVRAVHDVAATLGRAPACSEPSR